MNSNKFFDIHAPTHCEHESNENVAPITTRLSLQHLFSYWQSWHKSKLIPQMEDVCAIKSPPFWFDTLMGVFLPFKVNFFDLTCDKLLFKKMEIGTVIVWLQQWR
jgi:hypothetical protein